MGPSFEALWSDLEPLVDVDHRIKAKAILAKAIAYRMERDDPKVLDKRREDRTLEAESRLTGMPNSKEIQIRKNAIRDAWTETEERHRRGLKVESAPVMPHVSRPNVHRKSKLESRQRDG